MRRTTVTCDLCGQVVHTSNTEVFDPTRRIDLYLKERPVQLTIYVRDKIASENSASGSSRILDVCDLCLCKIIEQAFQE